MNSEPQPACMQRSPYLELRRGVYASNPPHVLAATLCAHLVHCSSLRLSRCSARSRMGRAHCVISSMNRTPETRVPSITTRLNLPRPQGTSGYYRYQGRVRCADVRRRSDAAGRHRDRHGRVLDCPRQRDGYDSRGSDTVVRALQPYRKDRPLFLADEWPCPSVHLAAGLNAASLELPTRQEVCVLFKGLNRTVR